MNILNYANGKFKNIYITLHQQSISSDIFSDLAGKAKVVIQTDDFNSIQTKDLIYLVMVTLGDWETACNLDGKNIIKCFAIKDSSFLQNYLPITSKKKISPVNMHKFLSNLEYHPCLGHTLAICYNGNVLPCPLLRNYSFGNVSNVKLSSIIEKAWETINKIWRLNLDEIERCTSCEFRYACNDCRALEESFTGRLEGKMLCGYNPKTGEWR